MNCSQSITTIAAALHKAQSNIGAAKKGSKNPFFKSSYASLGDVMEACKEHLLNEGITVLQPLGRDENGDYVETILLHESGEFISDKARLPVAKEHDPQAYGSATTYVRRYALQSMCFIPAEDDDAEGAMQRQEHPTRAQERPPAASRASSGPHTPYQAPEQAGDWRNVTIHFGKNKGVQLGELGEKQLLWYWENAEKQLAEGKTLSGQDKILYDACSVALNKADAPAPEYAMAKDDFDSDQIPF